MIAMVAGYSHLGIKAILATTQEGVAVGMTAVMKRMVHRVSP